MRMYSIANRELRKHFIFNCTSQWIQIPGKKNNTNFIIEWHNNKTIEYEGKNDGLVRIDGTKTTNNITKEIHSKQKKRNKMGKITFSGLQICHHLIVREMLLLLN